MVKGCTRLFLPLMLLVLGVSSLAASDRVRIMADSGHHGGASALAWSDGKLFTGGRDGTVRIWDSGTNRMIDRILVSRMDVRKIAVNPFYPHVAVLETDSIATFRISVWNWLEKRRLFEISLPDMPMFLDYSSRGNFLYYTVADWNSVTFLNSRTGRRLPYLRDGFGIVSFATVSATEQTIMTYNPSGSISYWDIGSGEEKARLQTLPEVSAISLSSNKRYMAGSFEGKLVFIDLTNGDIVATKDLPGITHTAVHPQTGDIAVFSVNDGNGTRGLSLWEYRYGILVRKLFQPRDLPSAINDLAFSPKLLYAADSSGTISAFNVDSGYRIVYPFRRLLPVDSLAGAAENLYLGSTRSIIELTSDILGSRSETVAGASYLRDTAITNPFEGRIGIRTTADGKLLLWNRDDLNGRLVLIDPENGTQIASYNDFSFPLLSVRLQGEKIYTLERNGRIRVLDIANLRQVFSYAAIGIQAVAAVNDSSVIAGRSGSIRFGEPLVRINTITGETVPIRDTNVVTFRLEHDGRRNRLFSLGMETRKDGTHTVLKVHTGPQFERVRPIASYRGEDIEAGMIYDEASGYLFTSLGMEGIRRWDGRKMMSFEQNDHIPRELYIHGAMLFATNSDSTVTVWNMHNGKILLDFYLYDDLNWVAVFPEGKFASSDGALRYISAYRGIDPYRGSLEALRLNLNGEAVLLSGWKQNLP